MAEPVFHGPGEGGTVGHPLGADVTFKVRGERSDRRLLAFETVVPPGQGPPLHTHAADDETLYVLEGEVRFRLGEELRTGGVGSFAFVPRGTRHTFRNVGTTPARILIHFAPSGMERFFDAFGALSAPEATDVARLGAQAGMDVVGPPLGP